MATKITLRVNGSPFEHWEDISYTRSLDTNAGEFSFSSSNTLPTGYPVRAGDAAQVLVNGKAVLTGYIDEISASGDTRGSRVSVRGRDNTMDLVDSSVPDSVKDISGSQDVVKLCQRVISALGANIPVVDDAAGDQTGAMKERTKRKTGHAGSNSGKKCMELLNSFARKAQVYLIPSGDGKLVVFRPGSRLANDQIINGSNGTGNNVKAWNLTQSWQERYHTYRITSQDNFADDSDDYDGGGTARKATLTDSQIRPSRYLELQAEESSDDEACSGRVNEEANLRRARSTEYCVDIADVVQTNGTLWDIGLLAHVQDDFAGIRGTMLVRTVSVQQNNSGGTQVKLTLCPPDAYKVIGKQSTKTKMQANIGSDFTRSRPA